MVSRSESELATIELGVRSLFEMVLGAISSATRAAIESDASGAAAVMERDALIDSLYHEIEELGQRQLTLRAPVAHDMRFVLSVLRIVPQLERSGDLAEHLASRAARGTFAHLPDRVSLLVARMSSVVVTMWEILAAAYRTRDATVLARLRRLDNDVDELHVTFVAEIIESELPTPLGIELALVGRFLERLGDHAVSIASRLVTLEPGVPPVS